MYYGLLSKYDKKLKARQSGADKARYTLKQFEPKLGLMAATHMAGLLGRVI